MQDEAPILEALEQQKRIRAQRAEVICELLKKCIGFDIYQDVLDKVENQPDRITRTHIAKALVEKNVVSRPQQAVDRFLKEGKRAFVKCEGLGLKELQARLLVELKKHKNYSIFVVSIISFLK